MYLTEISQENAHIQLDKTILKNIVTNNEITCTESNRNYNLLHWMNVTSI